MVQKINQDALRSLASQEWLVAQRLFFKNAKENSSYQTYNNLGYFLITEGLTCKNGIVRNAWKLGWKYLLKAFEMKKTQVSAQAMGVAIDYKLRSAPVQEQFVLYHTLYDCFSYAEKVNDSAENRYNRLRAYCLAFGYDEKTIMEAGILAKEYPSEECGKLYVELLRLEHHAKEALSYIADHSEYFDAADLLMLYATSEMYAQGFEQCEAVLQLYSPDQYIASAIMECCVKTEHWTEAKKYARNMEEAMRDLHGKCKPLWMPQIFEKSDESIEYRRKLLQEYRAFPAMITPCCYFGCSTHHTPWEE